MMRSELFQSSNPYAASCQMTSKFEDQLHRKRQKIEIGLVVFLVIPFIYFQCIYFNTPTRENRSETSLVVLGYLVLGCLGTAVLECTLDILESGSLSFWWMTIIQTTLSATPFLLGTSGLVPVPPAFYLIGSVQLMVSQLRRKLFQGGFSEPQSLVENGRVVGSIKESWAPALVMYPVVVQTLDVLFRMILPARFTWVMFVESGCFVVFELAMYTAKLVPNTIGLRWAAVPQFLKLFFYRQMPWPHSAVYLDVSTLAMLSIGIQAQLRVDRATAAHHQRERCLRIKQKMSNMVARSEAEDALRYGNEEKPRAAAENPTLLLTVMDGVLRETKTYIQSIYGLIELLLAKGENLNEEQCRDLQKIRDCGQSIVSLVSNATLFLKADAGVLSIERYGEIRIDEALDDILENEKRAEETDVEILVDIAEDVPLAIRGDITYLKYILQQLLNNAIKFTTMGTITISVKLIEESGQFVSLAFAVSDTGGGFGQRRREDLITPFGRTNTHPNAGPGLGIPACDRLARLFTKGKLTWTTNRVGGNEGAMVTFRAAFRTIEGGSKPNFTPMGLNVTNVLCIGPKPLYESLRSILPRHAKVIVQGEADVASAKRRLEAIKAGTESFKPAVIVVNERVLSKASSRTDYVEATQLGPEIKNLYREANVIVMAKLASRDKMRSLLIDGVLVKPLRFKFWDALTKKLSEPRASPGKVLSRSTGKLEFGNAQAILDTAGRRSSAPGSSTAPLSPSLQAKEARLPSSPQVVRLAIPEQRLPKLRVLVVEDNMLNQLVLSALIDKRGHYCVRADNGEAAVNCYIQAAESNNPIDLVFMDLLMPVMSGEEATRQIRKYEKDHNLPRASIIAITAAQDQKALQELVGDENDPDKLLTSAIEKPVNANIIETLLHEQQCNKLRQIEQLPVLDPSPSPPSPSSSTVFTKPRSPSLSSSTLRLSEGGGSQTTPPAPHRSPSNPVTPPLVHSLPTTPIRSMANTSSSSKKVLVVDDNVALAKIEERILTGQGWNVDVARHGQEALDMVKLKHDEYNVVLMDLFMPGMGGLQATKLIREFEQANQLRRLRIIALTGDSPTLNNESDQRAQSFSVGCDDFLKKPLDWKQLHSILSRNVVTTDDGSPQAYM